MQLFLMQLWDSSDLFLFVYSLFACVQPHAFPCTSHTHTTVAILASLCSPLLQQVKLNITRSFVNLGCLDRTLL